MEHPHLDAFVSSYSSKFLSTEDMASVRTIITRTLILHANKTTNLSELRSLLESTILTVYHEQLYEETTKPIFGMEKTISEFLDSLRNDGIILPYMVIRGYKIVYGRLINIPDDMDYSNWMKIAKLICSEEDYNNLEQRCEEVSGEEIKKELVIQLLYGEIYQDKLQQLIHTSHDDQHLHVEGKVCYEMNENIDPKLWSRIVWRWEKGSPMTLKDLILTTKINL